MTNKFHALHLNAQRLFYHYVVLFYFLYIYYRALAHGWLSSTFFNKLLTLFHIAVYSSINLLSFIMKDITLVLSKYFSFIKIFDIPTHLRELFTSWYDAIITFLSKEVYTRAFFYGYLSDIPILLMSTLSILIGCLRLWNKFL